jgi:hypothetical protein
MPALFKQLIMRWNTGHPKGYDSDSSAQIHSKKDYEGLRTHQGRDAAVLCAVCNLCAVPKEETRRSLNAVARRRWKETRNMQDTEENRMLSTTMHVSWMC